MNKIILKDSQLEKIRDTLLSTRNVLEISLTYGGYLKASEVADIKANLLEAANIIATRSDRYASHDLEFDDKGVAIMHENGSISKMTINGKVITFDPPLPAKKGQIVRIPPELVNL